jgi:hypothetical protein
VAVDKWHAPRIDDSELQEQAPTVRAEVLARLEGMFQAIEPFTRPREEDGILLKPDPRFVEAGIRILDRLMRLYRLDAPGIRALEEGAGEDLVAQVAAQLQELEGRLS